MIRLFNKILVVVVLTAFVFLFNKESYKINLFYTINYEGDNWQNHRTGMIWALSYLGAALPKNTFDEAVSWKDSTTFTLDLAKIGFDEKSLKAFKIINRELMKSDTYRKYQAIDIGQFIALTIGSSWHYYEITNIPKSLKEFYALKDTSTYRIFPVTNSSVAKQHRLLKYFTSSANPQLWLFIAEEGLGNLKNKTFRTEVSEVFDIMPNGQLRFGIYGKDGKLMAASDVAFGEAGKPAKCIWCHEIVPSPLYKKTEDLPGFISSEDFNKDILTLIDKLKTLRSALLTDVDFKKTQDHTQMELLYISYMNPSIKRLAQEWHLTENETAQIVKNKKLVKNEEFGFLGELYNRNELGFFNGIWPASIREMNNKEINFFK